MLELEAEVGELPQSGLCMNQSDRAICFLNSFPRHCHLLVYVLTITDMSWSGNGE